MYNIRDNNFNVIETIIRKILIDKTTSFRKRINVKITLSSKITNLYDKKHINW